MFFVEFQCKSAIHELLVFHSFACVHFISKSSNTSSSTAATTMSTATSASTANAAAASTSCSSSSLSATGIEKLRSERDASGRQRRSCLRNLFSTGDDSSSSGGESGSESDRSTNSDSDQEEGEGECVMGNNIAATVSKSAEAVVDGEISRMFFENLSLQTDGGGASEEHASVTLRQRKVKGIAHQLWPAAVHMCKYLSVSQLDSLLSHGSSPVGVSSSLDATTTTTTSSSTSRGAFNDYCVIELGAGVGLVGLYLAKLGFRSVILTDLEEAQPLLVDNIALNGLDTSVTAMVLRWGERQDSANVLNQLISDTTTTSDYASASTKRLLLVLADCVYWESLFAPLVATLKWLLLEGSKSFRSVDVLMCHVKRWKKDGKFFKLCSKNGIKVEVINECIERVAEENVTDGESKRITRMYRFHL